MVVVIAYEFMFKLLWKFSTRTNSRISGTTVVQGRHFGTLTWVLMEPVRLFSFAVSANLVLSSLEIYAIKLIPVATKITFVSRHTVAFVYSKLFTGRHLKQIVQLQYTRDGSLMRFQKANNAISHISTFCNTKHCY